MKKMTALAATVLLAVFSLPVFAQSADTPKASDRKPVIQGAKDSLTEGKAAVKESAREVKAEAKKGTRAVKRRVAVAQCNDGKYSYTRTNTCSDHGGVKERLKK